MSELEELSVWRQFKASPDGIEQLCERVAEGWTLRQLASELGIKYWTLYSWLTETPDREQRYARALQGRAEHHRETIEDDVLADGRTMVDVAMRRLRFDALKWTASKLAPKKYGDKIEVDARLTHDVVGELRQHLQSGSRLPVRRNSVLDKVAQSAAVVPENTGRDPVQPDSV